MFGLITKFMKLFLSFFNKIFNKIFKKCQDLFNSSIPTITIISGIVIIVACDVSAVASFPLSLFAVIIASSGTLLGSALLWSGFYRKVKQKVDDKIEQAKISAELEYKKKMDEKEKYDNLLKKFNEKDRETKKYDDIISHLSDFRVSEHSFNFSCKETFLTYSPSCNRFFHENLELSDPEKKMLQKNDFVGFLKEDYEIELGIDYEKVVAKFNDGGNEIIISGITPVFVGAPKEIKSTWRFGEIRKHFKKSLMKPSHVKINNDEESDSLKVKYHDMKKKHIKEIHSSLEDAKLNKHIVSLAQEKITSRLSPLGWGIRFAEGVLEDSKPLAVFLEEVCSNYEEDRKEILKKSL